MERISNIYFTYGMMFTEKQREGFSKAIVVLKLIMFNGYLVNTGILPFST